MGNLELTNSCLNSVVVLALMEFRVLARSVVKLFTMLRSQAIYERYRLNPSDLPARNVPVTISRVSYQGLEQLTPVLHLAEFPTKPLALNRQQCAALIEVTQSTMAENWIGQIILLRLEPKVTPPVIVIAAPLPTQTPLAVAQRRPALTGRFWSTLLLLLVLAAAFGAVYLLEHLDQVR